MASHRIYWADSMKAFSILAVVLNHALTTQEIKSYVYLVCLPAFFFIAGMFTRPDLTPKAFFRQKTLRLLIPFVIWGILSWGSWLFIGRKYGGDADTAIKWWLPLWGMLCGKTQMIIQNPPLWFLCCMICLEWIYYLVSRIREKWVRWILIFIIGGIGCLLSHLKENWFWESSAAMIILPIYAFGALYGNFLKTNTLPPIRTHQLCLLFFVSLIGIWIGGTYNGDIALAETHISNPILYYPSVLCVVGLWFSISVLLERVSIPHRLLSYIGQNTLLILCAHLPVFGIIKGVALLCHTSLYFFQTTLGCLCLWIGSFIILLPVAYVINRYCPILVGKRH